MLSVVEFSLALWHLMVAGMFTFCAVACLYSKWKLFAGIWVVALVFHLVLMHGVMADWAIVGMVLLFCCSIAALMWFLNGVEND